jgi:hypothetical protein
MVCLLSEMMLSSSEAETLMCQRCKKSIAKDKAAVITYRNRSQNFCDNCFKSVFKYDESLRTVFQLFELAGRKTPFVIRSNNWHRSSYMIVKNAQPDSGKNGNVKLTFIGDFYLRGTLKEQEHKVGKANHFLWKAWSPEEAAKYKDDNPPDSDGPNSTSA